MTTDESATAIPAVLPRMPRQSPGVRRGTAAGSAALAAGGVEPAFFLTDWLGDTLGGAAEDLIGTLPFGSTIYHALDAIGGML